MVIKLFFDDIAFVPVFIITKQPVPYVFFTMPGLIHIWPNKAACWSPAIPEIGISPSKCSFTVCPYISLLCFTSGSIPAGIPKTCSSSSSHFMLWILKSIVLQALVTSVTYVLPCVRRHISQVSIVPNASCPLFAFSFAPGTLSSIHFIFDPEK